MTPESLIAAARASIEADPDAHGLIDRCNVVGRTEAPDGFGGSITTETTLESDIPCKYNEKVYSSTQVSGGPLSHVTHRLYLLISSVTRAIQSDQKIVVVARGDMGQQIFEQPIRLDRTHSPLVIVGAKQVL